MDKLKGLMAYLIHRFPRSLSRTELVKLVYLTDVHYASLYGRSLTGQVFVRYHYGPYCEAIPTAADELTALGIIRTQRFDNFYYGGWTYRYSPNPDAEPEDYGLTPEEMRIADMVIDDTRFLGLDGIKRLAYQTIPMVELTQKERFIGRPLYGEVLDLTARRSEFAKRPLWRIKQAFKKVDLSHRGSDEEYAKVVEAETRELEPYRKRAEAVRA